MELLVSVVCFFVFIPTAVFFRSSVVDPSVLFAIFWGLMFLVYSALPWLLPDFDFYSVSFRVALYYLCLIGGFIIGCILSKSIVIKRVRTVGPGYKKIATASGFFLYKIVSSFSLILVVMHLIIFPIDLTGYRNAGALIRQAQTLDYVAGGSPLILLSSYCAYVVLPMSVYFLFVQRGRRSFVHWCAPLSLLVVSFVALAKYHLLLTLVTVLAVWFQLRVRSIGDLFKVVKPVLITMVVVPLIFLVSDLLRQDIKEDTSDSSTAQQLGFLISMYGVGHINNFGIHLEREFSGLVSVSENAGFRNSTQRKEPLFGERTFSGLFRIGHLLGINDIPSYTRYEGVKGFNTFSVFRSLADDFGFKGAVVASMLCGLILQTVWYLFPTGSIASYSMRTYIIWMLVYSAIHSLFNFIFFPIAVLLSPFIARKFHGLRGGFLK